MCRNQWTRAPRLLPAVFAVLVTSLLHSAPVMATRSCTSAEKAMGDAQLHALQSDAARQQALLERHLPLGRPGGRHLSQGGADNEAVLVQEGYVLLHDADLRTALWVSYELTREDIAGAEGVERVNCFRRDPRLETSEAAFPSDYNEPIFDQGHMANDADMKDVLVEQINTYVMSNMSPQYCRFNRGIWLSLEHLGRIWAERYETIYVTSGAVFDFNSRDARDKDRSAARMGSRNQKARVAIPSDYYKIYLRQEADVWRSIAFLLQHNDFRNGTSWEEVRPIAEGLIVTIESIEEQAEVSFFPDLDRSTLVQSIDGTDWDLLEGKNNLEGTCH